MELSSAGIVGWAIALRAKNEISSKFAKYHLIVSRKVVTFCVWKRWIKRKGLIFEAIHKVTAKRGREAERKMENTCDVERCEIQAPTQKRNPFKFPSCTNKERLSATVLADWTGKDFVRCGKMNIGIFSISWKVFIMLSLLLFFRWHIMDGDQFRKFWKVSSSSSSSKVNQSLIPILLILF